MIGSRVTEELSNSDARQATREFRIGTATIPARPLEPALYLVATPIGNLGDITIRALETLASADVLACEDTRVTRILLERYGIRTRPLAYHEHNANEAGPKLIAALEAGKSVALVSDAGTPLVSDPGYRLGQLALRQAIALCRYRAHRRRLPHLSDRACRAMPFYLQVSCR